MDNAMIESEAEEESEEEGVQRKRVLASDEDEDENAPVAEVDGYEEDGFVVTEPVEEEGEQSGGEAMDEDDEDDESELDEDDLQLIEENTGKVIKRKSSKKLKRLRKKRKTSETVEEAQPAQDEHIRVGEKDAQREIHEQLFGDDEDDEGPVQRGGPEEINFDEEEQEPDEFDDFIVNDDGGRRPTEREEDDGAPRVGTMNAEQNELLRAVFGDGEITFHSDFEEGDEEQLEDEEEKVMPFEPADLKAHFMEESDEKVRITDIPERLQLWHSEGFPRLVQGHTLEEEAAWICQQHLRNLSEYKEKYDIHREKYVQRVEHVLQLLLQQSLEVPFIAEYRKDYWAGDVDGLQPKVLWKIMDWHDAWVKFAQRRQALRKLCETEQVSSQVLDCAGVDEIHTVAELEDWFGYISQHQPADDGPRRRPAAMRRRLIVECQKHDVHKFVERFGLSAAALGDNLNRGYQYHKPGCESLLPEALAEVFVVKEHLLFSKPDSVLNNAVKLLAHDIGTHPLVRRFVRSELDKMSAVDVNMGLLFRTEATTDGLRVVHQHHRYFRVRQLEQKPASCFTDDEYLLLIKAEKEKLIKVAVTYSTDAVQRLKQEMGEMFLDKQTEAEPDEDKAEVRQAYNKLREKILDQAIDGILLPSYQKAIRRKMMSDAQSYVIESCAEKLRQRAQAGPYHPLPEHIEHDAQLPDSFTIMACCHSDDSQEETSLVILDENCDVRDHMLLGANRQNANYSRSIREFIEKSMPHVIVVGTSTMRAIDLQEDLLNICLSIEDQNRCPEGFVRIAVEFHNDDVASIFRQSPRASAEFGRSHKYTPLTLQAIALGRHLADPMMEFCNLAQDPDELLCLDFHELQKDVNKTELLKCMDRVLVDVVNNVGVDINLLSHNHFRDGPLQYVAGLGPRKALALRHGISQSGGMLAMRSDLIQNNMMGMKVYDNCVGFLKVLAHHDQNILDTTRIHPEMYEVARELAKIASEKGDEVDPEEDENFLIDYVMLEENKHLMENLGVQEWAEHFESQRSDGVPMKSNVQMIVRELQDPFGERRYTWTRPSWTEKFQLLTGEVVTGTPSQKTLYVNALLDVVVMRISNWGLTCITESGVKGILRPEDFSDNYNQDEAEQNPGAPEFSLESHVRVRQSIKVRVMDFVEENAFPAFNEKFREWRRSQHGAMKISCKGSVLRDENLDPFARYIPDSYFRSEDDAVKKMKKESAARKGKIGKHARQIDHPNFKNKSKVEVLEYMEDMDAGAFVIRPSSQGRNHLNITWKFAKFDKENDPDIYIHILVNEEGLSENVTVGNAFTIGDEKFEDLDELIASYLEPRIDKVAEMMRFRKYCDGSEEDVKQLLEKEKETQKVPYALMASREKVGRFVLMHYNKKMRKEYVMIRSDGYWYRKQRFTKPNDVVSYFKKNYLKPPPK